MNSFKLFCFLSIFSFLAIGTNAQEFKAIALNQGRAKFTRQRTLLEDPALSFINSSTLSFTALIDVGEPYLNQQNLTASDSPFFEMIVIISTSQSAFNAPNSTCINFESSSYQCEGALCSEDSSSPQIVNYPFFSANTTTITVSQPPAISIANGAWQLNSSSLLYVQGCTPTLQTVDTYGWLGLGTMGDYASNFRTPTPLFSFYVQPGDQGNALLIFGYNSSYADTSQTPTILDTDADWRTNILGLTFGNVTSSFGEVIPLIFETYFSRIYLPLTQYIEIITYLTAVPGMTCEPLDSTDLTDESVNQCVSFTGDISSLPTLDFQLANGKIFSLPPSAYMYQDGDGSFPLFEPFDSSVANMNYTVIGLSIMTNYYTVFSNPELGVNTITLYALSNEGGSASSTQLTPVSDEDSKSSGSNTVIIIVGVVVGVIILVCVGIGILGHKKGWWEKFNKKPEEPEESKPDIEMSSGVVSLDTSGTAL